MRSIANHRREEAADCGDAHGDGDTNAVLADLRTCVDVDAGAVDGLGCCDGRERRGNDRSSLQRKETGRSGTRRCETKEMVYSDGEWGTTDSKWN